MTTSPKGFPQIEGTQSPDGPSQINAAELFVENLIGEHANTAADLPASGNWIGRSIWVVSEKRFRVWNGSTWSIDAGTVTTPITMTGIYKLGNPNAISYVQGGHVYLEGMISNSSGAIFAGGILYTFGSIPVALAPAIEHWFPLNWGSDGTGGLHVGTNGQLGFQITEDAGSLDAGVLRVSMSGAHWRLSGI